MSGDAIGMMEGAFFVSKGVILDWMNELLDVSYCLFSIDLPLLPFCNSFNLPKLNNVQPVLFTARSWTPSTLALSI